MKRRQFLTSSLAASAFALAGNAAESQVASNGTPREYYELRQYHMQNGPQTKLTDAYVSDALIPALNRHGNFARRCVQSDAGTGDADAICSASQPRLETLVTAQLQLAQDATFMQAAAPFWNAPANQPAYVRVESSLMIAFEGRPRLKVPPVTGEHGKRIFQLRTYESPSNQAHVRKVEMFHSGEFEVFQRAGFWPVFYGDVLVGPRLPKLTYMLSYPDLSDMNVKWAAFGADPEWKKLTSSPRFNFEEIVSNITNLVLTPTSYSQI